MTVTAPRAVAPSSRLGWLPAFLGTGLMWGLSFLFIKVAVAQVAPVYVAFGRIAIGALTLLALLAIRRERVPAPWAPRGTTPAHPRPNREAPRGTTPAHPRPNRGLWLHLAGLAMLTNTVPFTLFAYAEQRVSSVLAGIWNGTAPLTTLAVTLLALRSERPDRRRLTGLLLGFAGVLVVLGVWHGIGGASLAGQLMLFGAVTCYGIAFNYMRWILKRYEVSGVAAAAVQLSLSTVQLAVLAPIVAGAPPAPWHLHRPVLASLLALGVFGSGVAFALNFHVVRVAGVTTASMVTYLPPVVGALAGVLVLHEHLTWNQPLGGLVVLVGVALTQIPARAWPSWFSRRGWRSRSAEPRPARC